MRRFDLNVRGTLFTVAEGVAAVQRWRIDHHDRVQCFGEGFPRFRRVCREQAGVALLRAHVGQRTEGQAYPGEPAGPGGCHLADAGRSSDQGGAGVLRVADSAGNDGAA